MGHNAGLIYAPVNTDDVVASTETNSHDIATLCASSKICRWAKWKPVRFDKIADLTTGERQSVNFGLALYYIASATSAAVNLLANLQTTLPTLSEWTYENVRPGTDWCRLTDFLNSDNPASPGYNHNAKPPMSGFSDITLFQSEFGSESKIYTFNFKWGAASNQGANDTSGIEIPITVLRPDITNGTWRFGLLIYFPQSGKYKVALASSPSAISESVQPGEMMIRPAGTGQLLSLYSAAWAAGVRELDAVPVLVKDASRTNATGSSDLWNFQASSQVIGMPMGEKIKIKLSNRFSNVVVTFNSITIQYLDTAGTEKVTYNLTPTDASSGMHKTTLAAPSVSGSVRCKIVVDFNISGTMASSDRILKDQLRIGLDGTLIDTASSTLERYLNSAWSAQSQISSLGGRYRLTATDGASAARTPIMNHIESLPRRSSGGVDIQVRPTVSLDGVKFNTTNYFYHHG